MGGSWQIVDKKKDARDFSDESTKDLSFRQFQRDCTLPHIPAA
jgi:hypothetical protein